jgi:hypothetical protein
MLARAGGPVFGIEPVLWLFAALGGLAMAGVRNFGNLFSAYAAGYAVGGALTLLLVGGVVARIGWIVSRRSQTVGILSGMAVIFFVTFGVIANAVNPPAAPARKPAALDFPQPLVRPPGPPIRPLPATAVGQLSVQWRYSGGRIDCIITNRSAWQVEDLQMEVIVWANRRTVRSHRCPVASIIPAGEVATIELPLDLELEPRQSIDCRVVSATGFEAPQQH